MSSAKPASPASIALSISALKRLKAYIDTTSTGTQSYIDMFQSQLDNRSARTFKRADLRWLLSLATDAQVRIPSAKASTTAALARLEDRPEENSKEAVEFLLGSLAAQGYTGSRVAEKVGWKWLSLEFKEVLDANLQR